MSLFPFYQLVLLGLLLVAFVIQLVYWMRYRAVAVHRHPYRLKEGEPLPPVSVVVIVNEDFEYIAEVLPGLMEQDHPLYEVVAVNDCGGPEVDDELEMLERRYANFRYTTIKKDDKFSHSRKIPLVVGIKACKYSNVLITAANARPAGDKWVSTMAKGFVGRTELVIGYCGFEPGPGFGNRYIRCGRLASSVRYLRAAVNGRAYKGIYNNIGYTQELFFENRGFTHLNMAVGEDDLFIRKVASRRNTGVVISPSAMMRQQAGGGLGWWWREQRYRTYAFRFYPFRVRAGIFTELASRFLLFVLAVLLGTFSGLDRNWLWAGAAGLLLLRELVMWSAIRKIARRLGERKLLGTYLLYDLVSPITETLLGISRRVKPPAGIWG